MTFLAYCPLHKHRRHGFIVKITDVETFVVATPPPHRGGRVWIFVKLTTDNGLGGYGEVYQVPFHPLTVARMIEDFGATYVVGEDPFQIERLWRRVYYGDGYERLVAHQYPDHSVLGILSALEMACWDIVGKALEQPVYKLLGGKYHERLRSYTYLYPDPDDRSRRSPFTDPEQAAITAAAYLEQGFTAVKFDPLIDVISVPSSFQINHVVFRNRLYRECNPFSKVKEITGFSRTG